MAMASAQINARIDKDLKVRGDAAMAAAGLTPTAAVRALWELAASSASRPADLLDALFPERCAANDRAVNARRQEKLALIQRGPNIVSAFQNQMRVAAGAETAALAYEELKEHAYFEAYAEEMGWGKDAE